MSLQSTVKSFTRFGPPVTGGTGFTYVYNPNATANMASIVAFCSIYSGATATTGKSGTGTSPKDFEITPIFKKKNKFNQLSPKVSLDYLWP